MTDARLNIAINDFPLSISQQTKKIKDFGRDGYEGKRSTEVISDGLVLECFFVVCIIAKSSSMRDKMNGRREREREIRGTVEGEMKAARICVSAI